MDKIDPEEYKQAGRSGEEVGAIYVRVNDPLKAAARKRAAIYARTALSQETGGEDFALAGQVRRCQLYCQERGYTVEERHIYSESGSGLADPRKHPCFALLLEAARHSEFDTVVLVSLDRLSRNQAYSTALLNELAQYGVTVECVGGEAAELMLEIKRCASEIERARIAVRAAHGRTARKAKIIEQ